MAQFIRRLKIRRAQLLKGDDWLEIALINLIVFFYYLAHPRRWWSEARSR